MQSAPRNQRRAIGIFGRRNAGKSSLLNALVGQQVSLVSDVAGTTTDPVEKPMELQPVGPVLFVDTAGLDDAGVLGALRVEATRAVMRRCDLALVVSAPGAWGDFERDLAAELARLGVPRLAVLGKADLAGPADAAAPADFRVSTRTGAGVDELRAAIAAALGDDSGEGRRIIADLVPPGRTAILVMPVDKEAPKGRLILPQAQAVRDLLDGGAISVVVQDHGLVAALAALKGPPALVVTDSQAFARVSADTPPEVPLTSFSILFARYLGDLATLVRGAAAIDRLAEGDRVLVAEACTHHPVEDDIGTRKLPRWLEKRTGKRLEFGFTRGRDLPADLASYRLVVHCGACMWNRREMLGRLRACREAGVPITNYGVCIAWCLGIAERALGPFPEALAALRGGRSG